MRASYYEWISDYLAARRMAGAVRLMMAFIAASFALCLLALLRSPDSPRGGAAVTMMWTALAAGVASALLWACRWPARWQSLAFVIVTNASVAMACLAFPNPQGAITGCIAFATTGAFIAFFHSTTLVLYNFAVAATVAVIAAVRVAEAGHLAIAAVDLFLVAQINIAMPVAIHVLMRALGRDLERADQDPLTGVLNRRSFQLHTLKMLKSDRSGEGRYLMVAMVDLDDFKRINDTRGHQAGDDALIAVGQALCTAFLDTTAVIARTGGEEFNVAVVRETADPQPIASRICRAIAGLPEGVTASVGTACAEIESLPGDGTRLRTSLNRLVAAADEAMYAAKRAGGNGYHHFDDQLL
jgi:diguanylate cyclase (GGDEF)-like protein